MKTFTKSAIIVMALLCSFQGYSQWITDTLNYGPTNSTFRPNSLYVSNQNTVHLAYVSTDNYETFEIIYRSKACGEDWTEAESILQEGVNGRGPAVTATMNNNPYIAFQKINETGSNIAITWKAREWNMEEIPGINLDNESPDIAIDAQGFIYLAWVSTTEDYMINLCYADNYSGEWNVQVIENIELGEFGWDADPDIEVTSDGTAYIFYNGGDPGNSYQYIATNSQPGGSVWKTERIVTPNVNDFCGGIEIYQDEIIHAIVEGDAGFGFPSTIYYTYRPITGDWSLPDTVNKTYPGSYMGMGVDDNGVVYAAYEKDEGNMLGDYYVADNAGGAFSDSLLMPSAQEIQSSVMCADKSGKTHVLMEYTLDFNNYSLLALRSGECMPTAIDKVEGQSALAYIYPNPAPSYTTLTIHQAVESNGRIDLYNSSGQFIKRIHNGMLSKGINQFAIDLINCPEGFYLVRIQTNEGVTTSKLVH